MFGKQEYYCANCGGKQCDTKLSCNHVKSMLCSDECRAEYELKYARMILGKDGLHDPCRHDRLTADGQCQKCGQDCRGSIGSIPA